MTEPAAIPVAAEPAEPEVIGDGINITDADLVDSDETAEDAPAAEEITPEAVSIDPEALITETVPVSEDRSGWIHGKYRTPEDAFKALENLEGLIGRKEATISDLRKRVETPSEAAELYELLKTNPDKAQEKIDEIRGRQFELSQTTQEKFFADPAGFIQQAIAGEIQAVETRGAAARDYESKLRQVYTPEGFEAMADLRADVRAAIDSGKIGDTELLHLAAVGLAVRTRKLQLVSPTAGPGSIIGPGGGGAGQPHNRSGKTTVEQEDDEFFDSIGKALEQA